MIVFCVLAHHNPKALFRLLKKLENFQVVVHIDRRVDITTFINEVPRNSRVNWLAGNARRRTNWGGWSIVEAQLELMNFTLENFPNLTHIVFLSGECFPIYPVKDFTHFLSHQPSAINFKEIKKSAPYTKSSKFLIRRITFLHPLDLRFFSKHKNRSTLFFKFCGLPSKFLRSLHLPNPGYCPTSKYYYGSQWVALHVNQVRLILKSQREMRKEFRFTYAPDELAIHSILARTSLASSFESVNDPIREAPFHLINGELSKEWTLEEFIETEYSSSWFIRRPNDEIIKFLETNHYF